ncbi:hypothetical protein G9F32_16275 [Acinetobacter sp. 194]|uniref:hypothetical protein n=1 Tax=Acinetobacter shaoyimingii TaxID=2715164 RepID=UPI00140A4EDE|nr:hypothetical protein [Acinetobacter shaoyimingii]NHB59553.1 hypothetical protein [Acinetobacter shaoyimingii]
MNEELIRVFRTAYSTKTFSRISFNTDDRIEAWVMQADAELKEYLRLHISQKCSEEETIYILRQWDETEFIDEFFNNIDNFNIHISTQEILKAFFQTVDFQARDKTIQELIDQGVVGLHLRHIIPYSDIAGLLRLATYTSVNMDKNLKTYLYRSFEDLIDLIGTDYDRGCKDFYAKFWLDEGKTLNMHNANDRKKLRKLYIWLAHSSWNLFNGNSGINKAIANSFDGSSLALGIHTQEHVGKLYKWWSKVFTTLGLHPTQVTQVYSIDAQKYVNLNPIFIQVYKHDLTRGNFIASGDVNS